MRNVVVALRWGGRLVYRALWWLAFITAVCHIALKYLFLLRT